MDSANFIPLGNGGFNLQSEKPEKVIGATKEDKKRIAREYRLKAKKEKKKGKSDAKKQRKENAILQRRMTRNNEKYSKNKDRNRQRAVDMERNKIRYAAVRQAEKLAGRYDLSGKLFNVGEVVIMPDGQVKSVEVLRKAAEVKEQREAERKGKEERGVAEEKVSKAGNQPQTSSQSSGPDLDNINPQRAGFIQTIQQVTTSNCSSRISNKQRKAQEMLNPRTTPPKPIIPKGYNLPEDEENFVAMWDLTNEEIKRRLDMAKQKAENARKALRRLQKEEKKFNQAMKVLRKQAASNGVLFDPEQAKRIILGEEEEQKTLQRENSNSSSDSESGGDSDFTSSSGSGSDSKSLGESELAEASVKLTKVPNSKPSSDEEKSKKRKRSIDKTETEPGAGTGKVDVEPVKKKTKKDILRETLEPEFIEKRLKKEKQRLIKEQKRIEKLAAKMAESQTTTTDLAKRKRVIEAECTVKPSKDIETNPAKKPKKIKVRTEGVASVDTDELIGSEKRKDKKTRAVEPVSVEVVEVIQTEKMKKKTNSEMAETASNDRRVTGENWNTDALAGDDARKEKFLRLLGAGRAGGDMPNQKKTSKKSTDIAKVQSDLEKQYEAGMKLKHDAGTKRRGLGA